MKRVSNDFQQFFPAEWFWDEIVASRFKTSFPDIRLLLRFGSSHDNRDIPRIRVGFEAAADFGTIYFRHEEVEEDEVRSDPADFFQGLPAGTGRDYFEDFPRQKTPFKLQKKLHIIHEQQLDHMVFQPFIIMSLPGVR